MNDVKPKGRHMPLNELMRNLHEDIINLRGDVKDVHRKIDSHIKDNHEAHNMLQEKLSTISEKSSINKAQIVSLVTFVTILVAGAVNYGFHAIG